MKQGNNRPHPAGNFFAIAREEAGSVFRDGGVVIFFFLVPLFYPLLYAFIYNNEVVRDVKLAVADRSDTYLSREFIRRIDATPHVKVTGICADMEEAKRMMDRKEAYGILLFPPGFSKDIHSGRQTTVSLYCDMSSILYYKALLSAATDVSLLMSNDFSIPFREVTIFNTQGGFASFLVPAILVLVIQQTLLLGICMRGATLRRRPTTLPRLLGQSFVYFLFYAVTSLWVLVIVPRLFSFPQAGNPWEALLFLLPYLLACVFFGTVLSRFVTSRESPFLLFVFTSIIFLFLSGISWPAEAMPSFWRGLSYFFPSTPGIQGYIRISSMGASLGAVAPEYRLLWIQAGVYFAAACFIDRYRCRRSRKS
jgi:ABC-2 type transport system permease protein